MEQTWELKKGVKDKELSDFQVSWTTVWLPKRDRPEEAQFSSGRFGFKEPGKHQWDCVKQAVEYTDVKPEDIGYQR